MPRTQGELLFERYLTAQTLPFEFEKVQLGKSKRPDYTIEWQGRPVVFDVKDFDPPAGLKPGFAQVDPYPAIREKINQACDKFREYKEFCCALVLRNLGNPNVGLNRADFMLGAMYGDRGFTFPVSGRNGIDVGAMQPAFLGRGKMIRPNWSKPQNTTISALVTLTIIQPHYQRLREMKLANPHEQIDECEAQLKAMIPDYDAALEVPRVIVWHNAVARIGFPSDLFCGPYDSHFGIVAVEQGITFRGSLLPSSVEL